MKFRIKFRTKRYTLLVVPEGTSAVQRVRFRSTTLAAVLFSLGMIVALTMILYVQNLTKSSQVESLTSELANSSQDLREEILKRDTRIEQLNAELLGMSEQAKEIELRLMEIEALESEMKAMFGLKNGSDTSDTAVNILSTENRQGVGGPEQLLEQDDLESVVADTKQRMADLSEKMPEQLTHLQETKAALEKQKLLLRTTPTLWPTKSEKITSTFGVRRDPFTGAWAIHSGLDIGGTSGDPIYAAADGKVTDAGYDRGRGNYVELKHPTGLRTIYMHLKSYSVEIGDNVLQGDQIARLGTTGRSTGPHLHFEVVKNGSSVDPLPYLKTLEKGE